jgi:osmoprotectant transport system ATP-binding protein
LEKTKTAISLFEITHRFAEQLVLSGITAFLEKDQITAILGKSGSGKSTLLHIINGLVQPDHGSIRIFEQPIDYRKMDSLRLQIGYVVQQVGLFPHMNVQQNISLLGKIRHQSTEAIHARVTQLLKMVQLPLPYLNKYPHELSGGEQQRVGICRAMFLNPPILLMDEPFGSLDYETKRHIYKNLLTIQKTEPRTIIIVTHDWDEAITLSDRFLWIEGAKIKDRGNKTDLEKLKKAIFS